LPTWKIKKMIKTNLKIRVEIFQRKRERVCVCVCVCVRERERERERERGYVEGMIIGNKEGGDEKRVY